MRFAFSPRVGWGGEKGCTGFPQISSSGMNGRKWIALAPFRISVLVSVWIRYHMF